MTTLSTRATVLGVTNPRGGRRDPRAPLSEVTALSGPLLSRFDLLLVLSDSQNPDWDAAVAGHILAGNEAAAAAEQQRPAHSQVNVVSLPQPSPPQLATHVHRTPKLPRRPLQEILAPAHRAQRCMALASRCSAAAQQGPGRAADARGLTPLAAWRAQEWPMERLRQYIAWVKREFRPVMSAEAEAVLQGYWHLARSAAAGKQAARSTVRMLESLVRLAQVWGSLSRPLHAPVSSAPCCAGPACTLCHRLTLQHAGRRYRACLQSSSGVPWVLSRYLNLHVWPCRGRSQQATRA